MWSDIKYFTKLEFRGNNFLQIKCTVFASCMKHGPDRKAILATHSAV